MASLASLRARPPEALYRAASPRPVSPVAVLLVALAVVGLALAALAGPPAARQLPPTTPPEATLVDAPRGSIPLIGDPIRGLTIWYSNRLSDASRGSLENLRGRFLTPIDPLADAAVRDLYGKILLITIPLLTLGGILLGYLVMLARTTGESAYTVRAVTPRFVTGAVLSVLGIFLVSIFAQFVIATDQAIVGVAMGANALGGPDNWPSGGGVFAVLQNAGFDPSIPQGPDNWNTGAWLSVGLLAAVLMTFLQMINAALSGLERLLVLVGPLCLAAYAIPATQPITNQWLKVLGAILLVRFAWTIVFALFSLETVGLVGDGGVPPTQQQTIGLLGLATGAALLMLLLPIVIIPLVLSSQGPLRTER